MTTQTLFIAIASCFFSFGDCPMIKETDFHPPFPYKLMQPNVIFEMPESLKEVSGLSLTEDGSQLAAVNDEEGIVFFIDKMNGEVVNEIKFWDDGDYEGLEIVGKDAYIIKSNGTIYQVKDFASEKPDTHKMNSFLNKENDVEGLAFDPVKNCLLVGCKGKIAEGEDQDAVFKKAIYEFDLNKMAMKNEPAYLLSLPDIQDYLKHLIEHDHLDKLLDVFSDEKKELKFSPSGIAIHPITKDVYVTSSKGKMLLVLNPEGNIIHLEKMEKEMHPQPEGICFDADGTLYIANEGRNDKAKVYKYLYQN